MNALANVPKLNKECMRPKYGRPTMSSAQFTHESLHMAGSYDTAQRSLKTRRSMAVNVAKLIENDG